MKERPILFSGSMIRAILDGRKTQTRRIVKPRKNSPDSGCSLAPCEIAGEINQNHDWRLSKYGKPGDRLWVRETHALWPMEGSDKLGVIYRATDDDWECRMFNWRPSIHMPRWASRITLQITDVRVERLNDISEGDAVAEGISLSPNMETYYRAELPKGGDADAVDARSAVSCFKELWRSINGPDSWQANPWVWCISFGRIRDKQECAA